MELLRNEISDMCVYLERMQKSIMDKLFFVDKVFEPFENIVDFGCANGELIKAIQLLFGDEYKYFGYDISPEMVHTAVHNVPGASFVLNWDELEVSPDKSLLNISSTIHEVYSYGSEKDIELFWSRVFDSGFKYISIRDMMVSDLTNKPANKEDLDKLYCDKKFSEHLSDYEQVWGKVRSERDLVHYLLKYSYTENWKREVRENYLALSLEEFKRRIPDRYQITYFDHFTLPYIAWQINNDFGIDLKTPTHLKIILKKC